MDYSCEDETGSDETSRAKLTVSDFDTATIRDVKYAIQATIQAPVCDQQLFYQGDNRKQTMTCLSADCISGRVTVLK